MNPDSAEKGEPLPIVPVPAAELATIQGERVLVGHASIGWRGDLRADATVVQDGRVFVPVLTEHEWYRSEAEQMEVFAPLMSVDRVWVEVVGDRRPRRHGSPGVRMPVPVYEESRLIGRRVVLHTGAGDDERNLRAASEIRRTVDGRETVLVLPEADWYRWTWTGRTPQAREIEAELLWAE